MSIIPTVALKRTVALIETLSKRLIDGLANDEAESLRWMIADGSVCFVLAATQLASMAIKLPPTSFRTIMTERMSEGLTSATQLKQLSNAVDCYMLGVFERAGVPSNISVGALGAFAPTAPPYIEPLLEVLERFSEKPLAARNAALALDVLIGHHVKGAHADWPDLEAFQVSDPDATLSLVRAALAFLSGNFKLPAFLGDAVPGHHMARKKC